MKRLLIALFCTASVWSSGIIHAQDPTPSPAKSPVAQSLIRVNSANQAFNFIEPWSKRQPFIRRGIGVVLPGPHVLVSSELLMDYNYIELEEPTTGRKSPARVRAVDYISGLALLEAVEPGFLAEFKPAEISLSTKIGDSVNIFQLDANGTAVATNGTVTSVQVVPYPMEEGLFLIYRINAPLLPQDGSFTVPIFREGKLIGVLMRYDQRNQSLDAIPAPVITRFLKEAALPKYRGFPEVGVSFSNLRDPQFREYVKLGKDQDGIYISDVRKGGPADEAGIKVGDILIAINDVPVDRDGNYNHPLHGKLALQHYLGTELEPGAVAKFQILRDGETRSIDVTLRERMAREEIIPRLNVNEAPRWTMVGGLVFQELTRRMLREWGPEWRKRAPQQLVYYDAFQHELFDDDRAGIVLLNTVLQDETNIGYEDISMMVVTKINDVPILKFEDVSRALQTPVDGRHKIEFNENPRVIYLNAEKATTRDAEIRQTYGLPAAQ